MEYWDRAQLKNHNQNGELIFFHLLLLLLLFLHSQSDWLKSLSSLFKQLNDGRACVCCLSCLSNCCSNIWVFFSISVSKNARARHAFLRKTLKSTHTYTQLSMRCHYEITCNSIREEKNRSDRSILNLNISSQTVTKFVGFFAICSIIKLSNAHR